MNNVMLDLEAMGNGPDAAIIAIGAVEFDMAARVIGERFYVVVDLESSVANGGVITPSTVLWWMEQSQAARDAFRAKGEHICVALGQFSGWLENRAPKKDRKIWGNGAAFDNVILASAYRRAQLDVPWEFWNDQCYRTAKAMLPYAPLVRVGTYHNAADDAATQANHLLAMLAAK